VPYYGAKRSHLNVNESLQEGWEYFNFQSGYFNFQGGYFDFQVSNRGRAAADLPVLYKGPRWEL